MLYPQFQPLFDFLDPITENKAKTSASQIVIPGKIFYSYFTQNMALSQFW
jgi:hypothetical protein